jgi:hypothetical protein
MYLAMSTSREGWFAILPPTDTFLSLVEEAASDYRQDTISAEQKPVTKLKPTSSSNEVWKEYKSSYQDEVGLFRSVPFCSP